MSCPKDRNAYKLVRVQTRAHTHILPIHIVCVCTLHPNTHTHSRKKDERPRLPMYTFCGAVGFSFGLGVARAGPYHHRHVGEWTRAFIRSRFSSILIVRYNYIIHEYFCCLKFLIFVRFFCFSKILNGTIIVVAVRRKHGFAFIFQVLLVSWLLITHVFMENIYSLFIFGSDITVV